MDPDRASEQDIESVTTSLSLNRLILAENKFSNLTQPVDTPDFLAVVDYMKSLPQTTQSQAALQTIIAMYYQASISSAFSGSYTTLSELVSCLEPILRCHDTLPSFQQMVDFHNPRHSTMLDESFTSVGSSDNQSSMVKHDDNELDMSNFSLLQLQHTPRMAVVRDEFDQAFKDRVLQCAGLTDAHLQELVKIKKVIIDGLYCHLSLLMAKQRGGNGDTVAVDERQVIHAVESLYLKYLVETIEGARGITMESTVEKYPEAEEPLTFRCLCNRKSPPPTATAPTIADPVLTVHGFSDLTFGIPRLVDECRAKYKDKSLDPYDIRSQLHTALLNPNNENLRREWMAVDLVIAEREVEVLKVVKHAKDKEIVRVKNNQLKEKGPQITEKLESLRLHRLQFTHCLIEMKKLQLKKLEYKDNYNNKVEEWAFPSSTLGRSARDQTIAQLIALQQAKGRDKPAVMAILSDFVTLSVLILRGNELPAVAAAEQTAYNTRSSSSSSSSGGPAVVTGEGMRILKLGRVKKEEDVVLAELAVLCMQPSDLIKEVEALYERNHEEKQVEEREVKKEEDGEDRGDPEDDEDEEEEQQEEQQQEEEHQQQQGGARGSTRQGRQGGGSGGGGRQHNATTAASSAPLVTGIEWLLELSRDWAEFKNRPDPYGMDTVEEEDDSVSDISQVSSDTETRQKKRQRQKRNKGSGCGNSDEHDSVYYDSESLCSESYEEDCVLTR